MADPSGPIMLAQEYLRNSLANSATFQAICGVDSATSALDHVYHDGIPKPEGLDGYTDDEIKHYRPYVIVSTDPEDGISLTENSTNGYAASGTLIAAIVQDVPIEIADDDAEAQLQFKNTLGAIFTEIWAQKLENERLNVRKITLAEGPYRSEVEDNETLGDHQYALLRFEWGPT